MSYRQRGDALKHYHQIDERSGVEGASPHRLIQMLLAGALSRIAAAQGFMTQKNIAKKGEHISSAISIIEGLRGSLNLDQGGTLAANLDRLYDYLSRRLVEANIKNDLAILSEVQGLLREIKAGWDGIALTPPHTAQSPAPTELGSSPPPRIHLRT